MKQRDANRYVRYLAKFIVNFWGSDIKGSLSMLSSWLWTLILIARGVVPIPMRADRKSLNWEFFPKSSVYVSTRLIHSAGSGFMISIPFFCCSGLFQVLCVLNGWFLRIFCFAAQYHLWTFILRYILRYWYNYRYKGHWNRKQHIERFAHNCCNYCY